METIIFKRNKLSLSWDSYSNGNKSLELLDKNFEPYMVASTSLNDVVLKDNEILIKNYSENEGILECLVANNIVKPTGKFVESGYVTIQICEIIK